jgi:hypothetical protein
MADLVRPPSRTAKPAARARGGRRQWRVQITWPQQALRQQVLDVGEHQLLVLLLVLHAQREQRPSSARHAAGSSLASRRAMRASTSAR